MSPDETHSKGTYRFVALCKECGTADGRELTEEQAKDLRPEWCPAAYHYERTGHTVVSINYDTAPDEVKEMVDAGGVEDIDFSRVAEYMKTGQ